MPTSRLETLAFLGGRTYMFASSETFTACAFLTPRDLKLEGRQVVSPDGKRFGSVAELVRGREFGVEVHAVESGRLEASALLKPYNFRRVRFTPDSKQFLVGTRDSIEILDIASGEWLEPVVLTPPDEADLGRGFTRRIPLGFGFPGDLYLTERDVVYSRPAALAEFDVAPSGVLVIGSETGDLVLASLETKQRIGVVGEQVLGGRPDFVGFSPTGRHLVAYARGELFLFPLTEEELKASIEPAETSSAATTPPESVPEKASTAPVE